MIDLNTLSGDTVGTLGYELAIAKKINDLGQVVGTVSYVYTCHNRAYLTSKTDGGRVLSPLADIGGVLAIPQSFLHKT